MSSPEFIHRDRKFQQLSPPGTVVVVKHKGVKFSGWWLSRAKRDRILTKRERKQVKGITSEPKLTWTLGKRRQKHLRNIANPSLTFSSKVDLLKQRLNKVPSFIYFLACLGLQRKQGYEGPAGHGIIHRLHLAGSHKLCRPN